MNAYPFRFAGSSLAALASGALWWPDEATLVVSDLHLGRSERFARNGGALLPPYEARETLSRLDADIAATGARSIICLGDSFDDMHAVLDEDVSLWLVRLMAGRGWIWIAGNHDPAPVHLGGSHLRDHRLGALTFRHIASAAAQAEVSGHFHPKARIAGQTRRCFLVDDSRLILPAYGTYTGGLSTTAPELAALMSPGAIAILAGAVPCAIPMPR